VTDEVGAAEPPVPAVTGTPAATDPTVSDEAHGDAGLGRRNDRLLIGFVAGYIVLLSALMIVRGVSITPDVLLVASGSPR
jgi:hypothetical protein